MIIKNLEQLNKTESEIMKYCGILAKMKEEFQDSPQVFEFLAWAPRKVIKQLQLEIDIFRIRNS